MTADRRDGRSPGRHGHARRCGSSAPLTPTLPSPSRGEGDDVGRIGSVGPVGEDLAARDRPRARQVKPLIDDLTNFTEPSAIRAFTPPGW